MEKELVQEMTEEKEISKYEGLSRKQLETELDHRQMMIQELGNTLGQVQVQVVSLQLQLNKQQQQMMEHIEKQ